jgi:hypothetical protein
MLGPISFKRRSFQQSRSTDVTHLLFFLLSVQFAGALATAMEAVRSSLGPGRALELLRKESLEGLPPTLVSKVGAAA